MFIQVRVRGWRLGLLEKWASLDGLLKNWLHLTRAPQWPTTVLGSCLVPTRIAHQRSRWHICFHIARSFALVYPKSEKFQVPIKNIIKGFNIDIPFICIKLRSNLRPFGSIARDFSSWHRRWCTLHHILYNHNGGIQLLNLVHNSWSSKSSSQTSHICRILWGWSYCDWAIEILGYS